MLNSFNIFTSIQLWALPYNSTGTEPLPYRKYLILEKAVISWDPTNVGNASNLLKFLQPLEILPNRSSCKPPRITNWLYFVMTDASMPAGIVSTPPLDFSLRSTVNFSDTFEPFPYSTANYIPRKIRWLVWIPVIILVASFRWNQRMLVTRNLMQVLAQSIASTNQATKEKAVKRNLRTYCWETKK